MKKARDAWYKALDDEFLSEGYTTSRYGITRRNMGACKFTIEEKLSDLRARRASRMQYPKVFKDKAERRKYIAHVLQGYEVAYIHTLTCLGVEYGYQVLGNEHDGLITVQPIPEEAIQRAREESGFKYAKLAIKPFKTLQAEEPLT